MKQIIDTYRNVSKDREYIKMIFANLVNRFGDSVDLFAFTWVIYIISGNPIYAVIMQGVNMIPTIFIQPFAGAFVERFKKKNVMIICDLLRALLVGVVAYAFICNYLTPIAMLVIGFANSTVECFRVPAGNAILPYILSKENYEGGISLNSSLSRIMELIGVGLAGVFIATIGAFAAFIVDMITFIVSAVLICMIQYEEPKSKSVHQEHYIQNLKNGLAYMKRNQVLLIICVFAFFINFVVTPMNSLQVAYVQEIIHGGSEIISILDIVLSIGIIIGGITFPFFKRYFNVKQLIMMLAVAVGIEFITLGILASINIILVAIVLILSLFHLLIGFLVGSINTNLAVMFTTYIKPEFMARSASVFGAVSCGGVPIASLIMSGLLQITDILGVFQIFGVLSLIIGGMILISKKVIIE